jgi:hypothetical protein
VDIIVTFEEGRFRVEPNPAIAPIGTPIFWLFRSLHLSVPRALWVVYFRDRWPFRFAVTFPENRRWLQVATINSKLGEITLKDPGILDRLRNLGIDSRDLANHSGSIGPAVPEEEGEYKYGVRAIDLEAGKDIGDDDPFLIIRHG